MTAGNLCNEKPHPQPALLAIATLAILQHKKASGSAVA